MDRERYARMNEAIAPSEALVESTIRGERRGKRARLARPLRIAIAAALVLAIGVASLPALAENVPAFYELLYRAYPDIAQFLMPVRASCEDNGIRMEVVSTYVHGDTAEVLVTLRDLTGDRVDGTTDLNDGYRMRLSSSMSGTCRLSSFDPETRTATFLLAITDMEGDIKGDKVTFSLSNFLSRGKTYEALPVSLDFANASTEAWTDDPPACNGYGGPRTLPEDVRPTPLRPFEPRDFGVEGIELTAVGCVDGELRIQTMVRNGLEKNNGGYFYYVNDAGEKVFVSNMLHYTNNAYVSAGASRRDYTEYVFDITPEEAARYAWFGDFRTTSMYTKGDWRVTVPLR